MRYYSDFTHIFTSAGLRETSFLALLMCYRISVLKKRPHKTQYFRGCQPSILSGLIFLLPFIAMGFPGGSDGKRICQQCRKPRSDPWVGKIQMAKAQLLSNLFFSCFPLFSPPHFRKQNFILFHQKLRVILDISLSRLLYPGLQQILLVCL